MNGERNGTRDSLKMSLVIALGRLTNEVSPAGHGLRMQEKKQCDIGALRVW